MASCQGGDLAEQGPEIEKMTARDQSPGGAASGQPGLQREAGSEPTTEGASLRESWQFSAIVSFSRLFGSALRLKPFSADQLERALEHSAEHQVFLSELVYKLLRPDEAQAPTGEVEGWHDLLVRKLSCNSLNFDSNPLEGGDFLLLTPFAKVKVLYGLCEWCVHESHVMRDIVKSEAEAAEAATSGVLQPQPVGEDAQGNRYFLLSSEQEDCRLYREMLPTSAGGNSEPSSGEDGGERQLKKPEGAASETVATSLEELQSFVEELSQSQDSHDHSMHEFLSSTVLPKLEETVAARRRAKERAALLEAMACKRSFRLQELQQRKENEDHKEEMAAQAAKEKEADAQHEQEEEERRRSQAPEEQLKTSGLSTVQPSEEESMQQRLVGQCGKAGASLASAVHSSGDMAAQLDSGNGSPRGRKRSASEALDNSGVETTLPGAVADNPGHGNPGTVQRDAPANVGDAAAADALAVSAPKREPEKAVAARKQLLAQPGEPKAEQPAEPKGEPVNQQQQQQQQAEEPLADQDAMASKASRPVRSSRMVVPRKYQEGEEFSDDEEVAVGPPPAKRPTPAKHAQPQPPPGACLPGGFPQEQPVTGQGLYQRMHPGQHVPRPTQQQLYHVPQFRALYPSALDLPVLRRRRSMQPRRPRSSRASMNRLKQAAHGTLPLGGKRAKSVYLLVGGGGSPEASASESEADLEGEDEEESSSEYSDSDEEEGPKRGGRKGRGRPAAQGGRQQPQQQQQQAGGYGQQRGMYPGGSNMQANLSLQQQQQLMLAQAAQANPQVRAALMQRMMQQQQQQLAAAQQAQRPPPMFAQLSREQQQAVFQQFLAQLPPSQQMAVRQLQQDQLMTLLQQFYQKFLTGAERGQQRGGPSMQQAPQQMMPQQQQMGMGPLPGMQAAAGMSGGNLDQARLAAVVSNLAPEARAQLQAMPPEQQRAVLAQLLQRHQLAEQQAQQQRMQQQVQAQGRMMGAMQQGQGYPPASQASGYGMGGMGQQAAAPRPLQQQGAGRGAEADMDTNNWFNSVLE